MCIFHISWTDIGWNEYSEHRSCKKVSALILIPAYVLILRSSVTSNCFNTCSSQPFPPCRPPIIWSRKRSHTTPNQRPPFNNKCIFTIMHILILLIIKRRPNFQNPTSHPGNKLQPVRCSPVVKKQSLPHWTIIPNNKFRQLTTCTIYFV